MVPRKHRRNAEQLGEATPHASGFDDRGDLAVEIEEDDDWLPSIPLPHAASREFYDSDYDFG